MTRHDDREGASAMTPRTTPPSTLDSQAIRVVESSATALRLAEARAFVSVRADREVLLVGASRGAVDDLARAVAIERGATLGLQRFSVTQLAARLAAPALAARGEAPATALGAEAVAARATFDAEQDGALAYFAPVARTPGFPRALARTIQELRLAGVGAAALERLPLGGRDLSELLRRFDEQFAAASATDRATLFAAAEAELKFGPASTSRYQAVLLLDVSFESPAEETFLSALLASAREALVTVPFGDIQTLDRLAARGLTAEVLEQKGEADLVALRRYLFASRQPPERERRGDVRFFSAPGEARESVEVARRILEEAERGVPFDEIAVFVRSPERYAGLLEHAFSRAAAAGDTANDRGIPPWFDRGTRRPHPGGRAFLAMLACAGEKLSARRFAEYLSLAQVPQLDPKTGGPRPPESNYGFDFIVPDDEVLSVIGEQADEVVPGLRDPAYEDRANDEDTRRPGLSGPANDGDPRRPGPPGHTRRPGLSGPATDDDDTAVVEGSLRAPWKWEELIVESAVIGGDPRRWHRRLDGLASQYRLKIREEAGEDPESPRIKALERDLRNLRHLRSFALPLIDRLAAWPVEATWGEWLDRFAELAPLILRKPDRVLRVLAQLRPMSAIGPVTLDEARDVVAERLLAIEIDPPRHRYGRVFVGSPHQARGRTFRVVFVPGLAERMFPQKPHEDPMLLDNEMRVPLAAGLATQNERARNERLLLRLAVGSATERLCLSYPRIDVAESRPRVPSFYALDVMRAITGHIPNHDELQESASAEGGAGLAWPSPQHASRAIDDLEHDLAVLRELLQTDDRNRVRGQAHYLLKLNESLKRSVTARWGRGRSLWTPFDGVTRVTSLTKPMLDSQRLAARPYSLSALQKFSNCPYQFLLSAIYRLEPAEEPEPLQKLDPLTRGALFHEAQAEFFRELKRTGRLPVTDRSMPSALDTLDAIVARVAAKYYDELAPAIDRVWNDEIAGIAKDLRVWARRLPGDGEWLPEYFEFSFGLSDEGRDPASLPDPVVLDGGYRLRGSIDLVETKRDGSALRVTDHKTGKNRTTWKTVIGGGAILQPVLYSLAVERALDARVECGRLFYCTAPGGFTDHPIPINEANRRAGLEALEIVDRAIELGFLPAAPADRACVWCDFRSVCGPHEQERIKVKPKERLGDLDALRQMP
jgi:ATP-dependent helicase/nuclease subunit B